MQTKLHQLGPLDLETKLQSSVGSNKNILQYFCVHNLNLVDQFHTFLRLKVFLGWS